MSQRVLMSFFLVVLLAMVALVGCSSDTPSESNTPDANQGSEETDPNEGTEEPVVITEFKQAPMLDDRDLPPVEERLPKEPKLANQIPAENLEGGQLEIGQYGGTLRMVSPDPEWNPDMFMMSNEPLLNTPGVLGEEVTPNILKDFEMSEDSKEFTFYMREGLKWSDGEPVTSEDIRFTVEEVIFNEELTPSFPNWLKAGNKSDGTPMAFEVLDEYSFKISFDEAYGRFPIQIALTGWRGYTDLLKPKHFLQDYHINYVELEELEPLIEEAGFEPGEWANLFHQKDITNWELTQVGAIGFPVLYPWIMVSSTEMIKEYERNPYFWKIDAEGNQFPYIDKVRNEYVQDVEMMQTKVIAGEVDLMRESAALNNIALYREWGEQGNYESTLFDMHVDPTVIFFNQTFDDPVWKEVVGDVRFRQAVNYALDREEIIDAIYYGFGQMPELVPSEYNPEESNRLLDEMGLDQKDSDGYRLGPDGKRFSIPFESGGHAPDINPAMELIIEHLKEVGIHASMKVIDSGLWGTRRDANELQATMLWNVQPMWRSGGWLDFAPEGLEGRLWRLWYTSNGEDGEEPPEDIKRLYELSEEIMTVYPGTPEDQALYEEIYRIHHEGLYQIPLAERVQQPLIINSDLGNVPVGGTAIAANIGAGQMYFKNQE